MIPVRSSLVLLVLPISLFAACGVPDSGPSRGSGPGAHAAGFDRAVPADPPRDRVVLGYFEGLVDPATGRFEITTLTAGEAAQEGVAPDGMRVATRGLCDESDYVVEQDGTPGSGPPDTIEVVTPIGTLAQDGACFVGWNPLFDPPLFCATVTVRSFYSALALEGVHAEILSMSDINHLGWDSVAEPDPGNPPSNTWGLWDYGDLDVVGNAPANANAVQWTFERNNDTFYSFVGRIVGAAVETCDGLDNDCDGLVDNGAGPTWYADDDRDGYGDPGDTVIQCALPVGRVATSGDCEDADALIHSGRAELCNGKDDNCDTQIDEGCVTAPVIVHGAGAFTTFQTSGATGGLGVPGNARLYALRYDTCSAPIVTAVQNGQIAAFAGTLTVRPRRWWTALTDVDVEGDFRWPGGTAPVYTNWAPGQPDNGGGGEDCVAIDPASGLWYDDACSTPRPYLCVGQTVAPPPIFYVSPAGSDLDDGTSPATPFQSLGAALAAASAEIALWAPRAEIRVCEGTYDEPLVVSDPVSFVGGWDCTTWDRSATWGYPAFGTDDLTVWTNSNGAVEWTLDLSGATVDDTAIFEGFRIESNPNGSPAGAIRVRDGASPILRNLDIRGGGMIGVTSGVLVDGGAPLVGNNVIDGGNIESYSTSEVGSAGIRCLAGQPVVSSNLIDGGSGSRLGGGGAGSVGVLVSGTCAPRPIVDNDINGGTGSFGVAVGDGYGSVALAFRGTAGGEVVGNFIRGGWGETNTLVTPQWGSAGILVGTGMLDVRHNSIHGGFGYNDTAQGGSAAVLMDPGAGPYDGLVLVGNMIDGGEPPQGQAAAVALAPATTLIVANNTIRGGTATGSDGTVVVAAQPGVSALRLVNNIILLGSSSDQNIGLLQVGSEDIASISNNLWLAPGSGSANILQRRPGLADSDREVVQNLINLPGPTGNLGHGDVWSRDFPLADLFQGAAGDETAFFAGALRLRDRTPRADIQVSGGGTDPDVVDLAYLRDDAEGDERTPENGYSIGADEYDGDCPSCAHVYFVSPTGSDSNSGLRPSEAFQTIEFAVAVADGAGPVGEEIRVCAGTYAEYVFIASEVSLFGGYDCSTWTRDPSDFYPWFAGTTESRITGDTGSSTTSTIRVDIPASSGDVVEISGFAIDAPAVTANQTVGVELASVDPILSHSVVTGGPGQSASSDGSIGVRVGWTSSPVVVFNKIDGGSGQSGGGGNWFSSLGLSVDGWASVRGNIIDGGSGTAMNSSGRGSLGCRVNVNAPMTVANASPFIGNRVNGGTGVCGSSGSISSAGILAVGSADIDFVGNVVDGGFGNGAVGSWRGLRSQVLGDVRVIRNRIYGGYGPTGLNSFAAGIEAYDANSLLVESNLVYGSNRSSFTTANTAVGVLIGNVDTPLVRNNTIHVGRANFSGVGWGIHLYPGVVDAVVENNVIFGQGNADTCLGSQMCASSDPYSAIRNNLCFGMGYSVLKYDASPGGTCAPWSQYTTIDSVVSHFATYDPSTEVVGNRRYASACGGDSGCLTRGACTNGVAGAQACATSVFTSWTAGDQGYTDLMSAGGWQLSPTNRCAITQSGLSSGTLLDVYGESYAASPSMGAHQMWGACVP